MAAPADKTGLTEQASETIDAYTKRFETDLVGIADIVAKNNSAEFVLAPHVHEAYLTLKRAGLTSKPPVPWYCRSKFLVGCGALIFSLGPTVASFARDMLEKNGPLKDQPGAMWAYMIIPPFILCILGITLAVSGWVKDE